MGEARRTAILETLATTLPTQTTLSGMATDVETIKTDVGTIKTDVNLIKTDVDTIVTRLHTVFYIASTDTKPTEANSGDELYYVDTGDYFVYYDDEWHLKVLGNYTPITFTLTFDKGDASAVDPASKTVTYDSAYGVLATHTYEGYDLAGWFFDEATLLDEVEAADIVKIEANTTVYPKYVPIEYDITYNLDGGTNNAGNPAKYTIEDAVAFLDPTKDGYTFDGWFSDMAFNNPATGWVAGSTGNYEVWAKFTANP